MKIAIDLNDVVRDFSNNFVRYYIEGYDRVYNEKFKERESIKSKIQWQKR